MYGLHNTHLSVPIQIGLDGPSARDAFFNKDRRTIDYAHLLLHVAHILGSQVPKGNLKSDYSTSLFVMVYPAYPWVVIVIAPVAFTESTYCSAAQRSALRVIMPPYQNHATTKQLLNLGTSLVTVGILQYSRFEINAQIVVRYRLGSIPFVQFMLHLSSTHFCPLYQTFSAVSIYPRVVMPPVMLAMFSTQ